MSCSKIFENIEKHISLNEDEKRYVESILITRNFNRKEMLLQQGLECRRIYFVEYGSLRAYNTNQDEKESTVMFALKDWWITDMNAFTNQTNSLLTIETLEQSQVIEIDYYVLEKLFRKIPKFEKFFRILFQNAYIREQQRVLQNISLNAEERYFRFINKYPAIVEKVTQKQIACYLGVTPEFLSSIKNNSRS